MRFQQKRRGLHESRESLSTSDAAGNQRDSAYAWLRAFLLQTRSTQPENHDQNRVDSASRERAEACSRPPWGGARSAMRAVRHVAYAACTEALPKPLAPTSGDRPVAAPERRRCPPLRLPRPGIRSVRYRAHGDGRCRQAVAVLHKLGGDSSRESKVVAGWHEQTDTGDLQNHELASVQ